ncbi:glycoside hydrolase family 1 protein [Adhaeribacter radiodurans]|uniref:Beta-glucosidase n=1 Tax=Adhaeribacter radiodurans TaxID=2745197 RepID=A0A7L7L601_9BACT|nr:beta-glucosidase [Adhaeribacter radiodurans]QMU28184.1 beta-glucosidase [Adhaeribacter radiodurans]
MVASKKPHFKSFLMGGFEAACHVNGQGRRLDMIRQTQHDIQVEQDYALVKSQGFQTVRDGVRWPLIEKEPGVYDFSSLEPMAVAAQRLGMQVIWTLCHYGWPDDLDVFSPEFITRFAAFSQAVATFLSQYSDDTPFFTPVNEISYFCWVGGEVGTVYPYGKGRGYEMKLQLVRAALASMDAIWEVCPQARFVHVEPLIHVAVPPDQPELREAAHADHATQFEAYDIMAGMRHPELGGNAKYLDIIGCNFYHDNEWFYYGAYIPWHEETPDSNWVPLHQLIEKIYKRYRRPIIISETSHYGGNRPAWMRMIIREIQKVLIQDIPFLGVCLYPILDRSDWENDDHWHNSGLWDYSLGPEGRHLRVLAPDYAAEIQRAVQLFSSTATKELFSTST